MYILSQMYGYRWTQTENKLFALSSKKFSLNLGENIGLCYAEHMQPLAFVYGLQL